MQSSGIDNNRIKPKVDDEFIARLKSTLLDNRCDLSNFHYDNLDNDLEIKIVFLCDVEEHLETLGYKTTSTIRRYQYTSGQFDQKKTRAANLSILNAPFKHKLPFQGRKRKWNALILDVNGADTKGGGSSKGLKLQKVHDEVHDEEHVDYGNYGKQGKSIQTCTRLCEKNHIQGKEQKLSDILEGRHNLDKLIDEICTRLSSSSQQSLVGGKSSSCTKKICYQCASYG